MHFIVIGAFALVLSVRTPTRSWWLFDATWLTIVVVVAEMVVVALLAMLSSIWVRRRLAKEPWDPDPAQRLFGRCGALLRGLILIFLAADVLLTPWLVVIRKEWGLQDVVALDDLVALLPFFVGVILSWAVLFPADRAIRDLASAHARADGEPARRVWRLSEYLLFNVRYQLLLIVVPMTGILVAYDLAAKYSHRLYAWTHLDYAEQVAMMFAAGLMFLISPLILRYVWSTAVLPSDGLRGRLQRICDRIRLRYQEILIWRSDGVVVNAAVMGLIPTFRYILLSDGLLETMKEEQIEAVFGHEAGHVKHHHIHFYLLFAALSMFIVGGVLLAVWNYLPYAEVTKWISISRTDWNSALDLGAMTMVLMCWAFGFGWVSRRFERQADVFGVRCVGENMTTCDRPECRVHHPSSGQTPGRKTLCPAAADVFALALHRIAVLNGIAPRARSWRHSSIASRMDLVRALARDPKRLRRFGRTIVLVKLVLILGCATGSAVGGYIYWPQRFIDHWFGTQPSATTREGAKRKGVTRGSGRAGARARARGRRRGRPSSARGKREPRRKQPSTKRATPRRSKRPKFPPKPGLHPSSRQATTRRTDISATPPRAIRGSDRVPDRARGRGGASSVRGGRVPGRRRPSSARAVPRRSGRSTYPPKSDLHRSTSTCTSRPTG